MKKVLSVFKRRDSVVYPEMTIENNTDSTRNKSNIDFESKSYFDSDSDYDSFNSGPDYNSQPKFGIGPRNNLYDSDYSDTDTDSDNENHFVSRFNDVLNDDVKIYRSYTITCEKDDWNIKNGRCPDYALDWQDCFNEKHWPTGHDFINGNIGSQNREEFLY
jgi:hypothetical protein